MGKCRQNRERERENQRETSERSGRLRETDFSYCSTISNPLDFSLFIGFLGFQLLEQLKCTTATIQQGTTYHDTSNT